MTTEQEKHRVWFESVVQPKLHALLGLSDHPRELLDFDDKLFFKELLADLELLALDDFATENQIEKICAGLEVLRLDGLNGSLFDLRDLALIATLENVVDRFLFFQKWQRYQNFRRRHGAVADEALVNAFRISALIKVFVHGLQVRASVLFGEGGPEGSTGQAS